VDAAPPSPVLAPLAGLRVLELGSDVSLAFAARLLADLGAEVLRPEPAGGDALRQAPPLLEGGGSALFAYLNHGKRCLVLDDARLIAALAREADLVLWAPESGAAYAPLLPARDDPARRPTLVLSAHGLTGPRAGMAGTAFTAQHAGGFAYHQACPVSDPEAAPPLGCPDREAAMLVGLIAANAAMTALMEVGDGPAPYLDLSAEDVFAWMLVDALAELHDGTLPPGRKRAAGARSPSPAGWSGCCPASDGTIMVSPREDHQWARWVELMGQPGWTSDAALCGSRATRTANAAELGRRMSEWSVGEKARDDRDARPGRARRLLSREHRAGSRRQPAACCAAFLPALGDLPVPGLPFAMRDSAGFALPRGEPVTVPQAYAHRRLRVPPTWPLTSPARAHACRSRASGWWISPGWSPARWRPRCWARWAPRSSRSNPRSAPNSPIAAAGSRW
jgi:crotonobetainyl-CoA:carnitine CoA-transferase CaiB-like acyl-CoA transferase